MEADSSNHTHNLCMQGRKKKKKKKTNFFFFFFLFFQCLLYMHNPSRQLLSIPDCIGSNSHLSTPTPALLPLRPTPQLPPAPAGARHADYLWMLARHRGISDVVEVIPGAADQFPDFHSVGRDLRAPGNWQRETGNSRLAQTAPA